MNDAGRIVRKIQVTEKGTSLQTQNKYLFEVHPDANKIDVRRAIEQLFKVKVTGVNTMNYSGKRKRERSIRYGKRSDWKRAVVTLQEGQTIEMA
jgi:large subunit ribosomal protein L23